MDSERALRESFLRMLLKDSSDTVKSYSSYSIARYGDYYVIIGRNRDLYVVKPVAKQPAKPGLIDKLRELKLPISTFKPFLMSAGTIAPLVTGGRRVKEHNVKGWILWFFKGPFKFKDERGFWVQGMCTGLLAIPESWEAIDIPSAVKEMIKLHKEVEDKIMFY